MRGNVASKGPNSGVTITLDEEMTGYLLRELTMVAANYKACKALADAVREARSAVIFTVEKADES